MFEQFTFAQGNLPPRMCSYGWRIPRAAHGVLNAYGRKCIECLKVSQRQQLQQARVDMEARKAAAEELVPRRAVSADTAPALGSVDFECARIVALPPHAEPSQVLRLPPRHGVEEARRRFRHLALMLHPDKCMLDRAEEAFKAISAAMRLIEQRAGGGPAPPARSASART